MHRGKVREAVSARKKLEQYVASFFHADWAGKGQLPLLVDALIAEAKAEERVTIETMTKAGAACERECFVLEEKLAYIVAALQELRRDAQVFKLVGCESRQ